MTRKSHPIVARKSATAREAPDPGNAAAGSLQARGGQENANQMGGSFRTQVGHNVVNRPPHYTMGGIEVIDAIEAWQLGFHLGNALKYIARAGKKDPAKVVEDLRKARWYLEREIARLEGGK